MTVDEERKEVLIKAFDALEEAMKWWQCGVGVRAAYLIQEAREEMEERL